MLNKESVTNDKIQSLHSEYDHNTSELRKALQFYEHQLFIHMGHPLLAGRTSRELDSFDEVKKRATMHEVDDYINLKSKQATAMSRRDEELTNYIIS